MDADPLDVRWRDVVRAFGMSGVLLMCGLLLLACRLAAYVATLYRWAERRLAARRYYTVVLGDR